MKWKDKLLSEFIYQLQNSNQNFDQLISQLLSKEGAGIHLAIFNEPFVSEIISKNKTIESRFSINRINPFRRIYEGDIVLIKITAGNVVGFFICGKVEYWIKSKGSHLQELEERYGKAICTYLDPNFWVNRTESRYGTLMEIKEVYLLDGFNIGKQDRTTWVVLKDRNKPSMFNDILDYHE